MKLTQRSISVFLRMPALFAALLSVAVANASASDAAATDSATTLQAPLPLPAKPKPRKKMLFRYRLGLGGESFNNEKEQAQTVGLAAEGELRYRPMDSVELHADAKALAQSGQSQSRFGDNVPQSGVFLGDATVAVRPIQELSFAAGAVNQDELESPLLISPRPFPGAVEKVILGTSHLGAELRTEQTVPTSVSLATKTVDREATPYFFAETLKFVGMPTNDVKLETFGTYYDFSPLPSQVALDSEIQGNTIIEQGNQTSAFLYDFRGWLGGVQGSWLADSNLKFMTGVQMLQNLAAPADSREGFLSYLATDISTSRKLIITPRGEYFFNESDTSPAFYNSSEYGHNNRRGYAGEMIFNFVEAGFKVKGRYVMADVINPNLYQSKQQYFLLSFETAYAQL